jgi:hypothetical protein
MYAMGEHDNVLLMSLSNFWSDCRRFIRSQFWQGSPITPELPRVRGGLGLFS